MIANGSILSDAEVSSRGISISNIGITGIKQLRLSKPIISCPGVNVGACVPFYLCPRSIMLYLMYRGNHPDLSYRGGQEPIVHLAADLKAVTQWADANGRPWAFTNTNAALAYAEFYNNISDLDKINWDAVVSDDFTSPSVKDGKQAEFLMHRSFPW